MQFQTALLSLFASLFFMAGCVSGPDQAFEDRDKGLILDVIQAQQKAWNEGDIEGFMQGYWQDEALRFASGGTVTRGWRETLARYQTNYDDRAKMGMLEFSELEVEPLASDAAILYGRWALQRADDRPSGLFTLILRKIDGNWRVVSDTTTSAD